MLTGLNRAITDYVARFDPEHLEDKFSNGKRGSIMGAASKLKYWDLYKDLYLVLSQQASGELPQVFLEELSRAYEHEATKAAPKTSQPAAKRKAS
jgi:type VI secretion system protein ImpI/type VI secretion system protein